MDMFRSYLLTVLCLTETWHDADRSSVGVVRPVSPSSIARVRVFATTSQSTTAASRFLPPAPGYVIVAVFYQLVAVHI